MLFAAVHESLAGTKPTCRCSLRMSVVEGATERGLPPDLYDTIRWFCQVTGLASGLKVASLVADIVERLPDAALDPAILSEQS